MGGGLSHGGGTKGTRPASGESSVSADRDAESEAPGELIERSLADECVELLVAPAANIDPVCVHAATSLKLRDARVRICSDAAQRDFLKQERAQSIAVRRGSERLLAERRVLLEQSRRAEGSGRTTGARPGQHVDRLRLEIEAGVRAARLLIDLG